MDANESTHLIVQARLARRGSTAAIGEIIRLLSHEDYYIAEAASESFWRIGERSVSALIDTLRDRNALVQARILAAEALNSLGTQRGTQAQLDMLQDPKEPLELRSALASYVGFPGNKSALRALILIALDKTSVREMRDGAIVGLGYLRDADAVPVLQTLTREDDRGLQRAAQWALRVIGGEET